MPRVVPRVVWTDPTGQGHGMTVTTRSGYTPVGGKRTHHQSDTIAEHLRQVLDHLAATGCTDVHLILWPAEMEERLRLHRRGSVEFAPDELVIELPDMEPVGDEHGTVETPWFNPGPDATEVLRMWWESGGAELQIAASNS